MAINVDVNVTGVCQSGSGCGNRIGSMTASHQGSYVHIGFVSKALHRVLRFGITIQDTDLDAFCRAWLVARGAPTECRQVQAAAKDLGVK